jgi:hypothetical protein
MPFFQEINNLSNCPKIADCMQKIYRAMFFKPELLAKKHGELIKLWLWQCLNHSQSITDGNFAALWPTYPLLPVERSKTPLNVSQKVKRLAEFLGYMLTPPFIWKKNCQRIPRETSIVLKALLGFLRGFVDSFLIFKWRVPLNMISS